MKFGLQEILALVSILMIFAAIGLGWFATNKIKRPTPDAAEGLTSLIDEAKSKISPKFITFKKIQTNIMTQTDRLRHAEIEISIEPMNVNDIDKIKAEETFATNELISIVSEMSFEELISISSKIVIGEKLKSRLNERLEGELVKRILFPTFIVN
jgi:flagellar basal body-associated protein FliL